GGQPHGPAPGRDRRAHPARHRGARRHPTGPGPGRRRRAAGAHCRPAAAAPPPPATEPPPGTQLVRARAADAVLLEGPPALVLPAAEQVDWIPGVTAFAVEDGDGAGLVANAREGPGQLGPGGG